MIEADITLLIDTSAFRRQGAWLAGPCPLCGGTDRFAVNPSRTKWFCRGSCIGGDGKYHDAANLLMWRDDIGFPEACRILEVELAPISPQSRTVPVPKPRPEAEPPDKNRMANFARYASHSRDMLWGQSPGARGCLNWLRARGLTDATIRKAWLGYAPGDMWRSVVIPWIWDSQTWAIRKRFGSDAPQKYGASTGSKPILYESVPHNGGPCVVSEGEFEAMLIGQEAMGQAGSCTLGSASAPITAQAERYLRGASRLYLMNDADEAGDNFAKRFLEVFPEAVRVPPFFGKDAGEMFLHEGSSLANHLTTLLTGPQSMETETLRLFPGSRVIAVDHAKETQHAQ